MLDEPLDHDRVLLVRTGSRKPLGRSNPSASHVMVMHWGQSGAGPRLALEMTKAMLRAPEFDVVSLCYNGNAEIADRLDDVDCLKFRLATYRTKSQVLTGVPRLIVTCVRLRRFMTRNGVTAVVSAMDNVWQSLAVQLYLPRRIMLIASVHDANEHLGENSRARRLSRRMERRRADIFLTYSSAVADAISSEAGEREVLRTVFPALDSAPAHRSPRQLRADGEPARVGFFGRIEPYKGLDLFVEALHILRSKGVDARGVVYGQPTHAGILATLDRDESIAWNIGWVPDSEVNDVVAGFDVLVLPYLEASQSGVLAVALSEGVPSVVTPVGGLPEQVETTAAGLVATEVTAAALADSIATLLRDPDAYRRMSENALQAASASHSWDRVTTDIGQAFARMGERPS